MKKAIFYVVGYQLTGEDKKIQAFKKGKDASLCYSQKRILQNLEKLVLLAYYSKTQFDIVATYEKESC